jgi:hypothetical protein
MMTAAAEEVVTVVEATVAAEAVEGTVAVTKIRTITVVAEVAAEVRKDSTIDRTGSVVFLPGSRLT